MKTELPTRVAYRWGGYRACIAATEVWSCREFADQSDEPNGGPRTMLATLGNEGWDLVSSLDERHETNSDFVGLSYLFKRQRQ